MPLIHYLKQAISQILPLWVQKGASLVNCFLHQESKYENLDNPETLCNHQYAK